MNPAVRQNVRDTVSLQRRCLREAELNTRRHIAVVDSKQTTRSSTELVTIIANKLKTKQHITQSDLNQLKNSIMESEATISVFLQVNGALNGLVRELAANDAIKQISAIACFCNLALGDEKAALAITKACGTYLVALLDSLNKEIIITSAWTIGNLASAGVKSSELIKSQGAYDKLLERMETYRDEDVIDAITYGLTHYVYVSQDTLGFTDLLSLLQVTMKQKEISPHMYQLLVLLSCHTLFPSLQRNDTQILFDRLLSDLKTILDKICDKKSEETSAVSILRILANLCSTPENSDLLLSVLEGDFSIVKSINSAPDNNSLNKNLFWLIGNIIKFAPESLRKNIFLSYISTVLTV